MKTLNLLKNKRRKLSVLPALLCGEERGSNENLLIRNQAFKDKLSTRYSFCKSKDKERNIFRIKNHSDVTADSLSDRSVVVFSL